MIDSGQDGRVTVPDAELADSGLPAEAMLPARPDADFDRMAQLARRVLEVPSATVCLVTRDEHLMPGAAGIAADLDESRSLPLSYSLCRYVVRDAEPLIVADTLLAGELAYSPAVTELGIRAYAGMPLVDADDTTVGSLAVADTEPRDWTDSDLAVLADLAAACSAQLKLRQVSARAAVVGERDRIATKLHQDVVGALFEHSLHLSTARSGATGGVADEITGAIDRVDAIIVRLRNSIYQLG